MFSSRLKWSAAPNALTLALRGNQDVLDLTGSNPTRAGIAYDEPEILRALSDPGSLRYEPSPFGLQSAREAVAGYEGVSADRIVLTASTSEAYSYLFKLFCNPGDEVLVPRPSYPLFEYLAALDCVRVKHYPLRNHEGWWLDFDALRQQVTPRTRAVIVVNPNNPTGSYLKPDEHQKLKSLGLPLISDEVFRDYAFETPYSARGAFVLNGFSKLLGLPQMKLGWIVVPEGTAGDEALSRLELIADTYLSVSAPVQHAAARWLALRGRFHASIMQRLRTNLAALGSPRVEGGWYAIVRLPRTRTEEEWCLRFLEKENVLVQPGYFYDFEQEAYVVVSLLTQPDEFKEGMSRIWKQIA